MGTSRDVYKMVANAKKAISEKLRTDDELTITAIDPSVTQYRVSFLRNKSQTIEVAYFPFYKIDMGTRNRR